MTTRHYQIKPGDTLTKIAKTQLNDASRYREIQELNSDKISDPNIIPAGDVIKIPAADNGSYSQNTYLQDKPNSSLNLQEQDDKANLDDCTLNCSSNSPKKVEEDVPELSTSIRFSLFFDGTANNRTNTDHRNNNSETYNSWRVPMGSGSYENDYSNIAKLEKRFAPSQEVDHSFSLYIEGIGTQNSSQDMLDGLAEGKGTTGVIAKVHQAIDWIKIQISSIKLPAGQKIDNIYLDAFGFSRGAAAARYFIHAALVEERTKIKTIVESMGYEIGNVEVLFVGLFDTVASYGLIHTNDTKQLNLDAIKAASQVVQLAAAEEHRKNFRLTNIKSANSGIEIFLPGVHSDIGGGYRDDYDEKELQILDIDTAWAGDKVQTRFQQERQWLLDSGWYLEEEIAEVNFWNELKVTRNGISNKYSRIPMQIMSEYALKNGINFKQIQTYYPIPSQLLGIVKIIYEHLGTSKTDTPNYWWSLKSEAFKKLRHNYLHFSSFYGGTNAPQFTENDNLNGERQRIIQDG